MFCSYSKSFNEGTPKHLSSERWRVSGDAGKELASARIPFLTYHWVSVVGEFVNIVNVVLWYSKMVEKLNFKTAFA